MPAKRKRAQPSANAVRLDHPAPVTLTLFLLALLAFLLSGSGGPAAGGDWFALVKTSFADPMQYVRLFSFALGSGSLAQFLAGWILILLAAPPVEEQFGPGRFSLLLLVTVGSAGLLGLLCGVNSLTGSQCIVIQLLALSVILSVKNRRVPLLSGLALVLYLWQQTALLQASGAPMPLLIHLGGAAAGVIAGLLLREKTQNRGNGPFS